MDSNCIHCTLPLPAVPITDLEGQKYCCNGCKTVYAFLHQLNLEQYYQVRKQLGEAESNGSRPARVEESKYSHWDHRVFIERGAIRVELPTRWSVTFILEGIHCSACIWLLEKLPERIPGISEARVDFGKSEIGVVFDPTQIKLSEVAQVLNQMGYPPRLLTDLGQADREASEEKERRAQLLRLGVAGFCAGNSMMIAVSVYEGMFTGISTEFLKFFDWVSLVLSVPAVFYSAYPFYQRAYQGIRSRMVHMDLPISLAILGAFGISLVNAILGKDAVYFDTLTALIFLLLLGRWLQASALRKVRRLIERSHSFLPDFALLENGDAVPIVALKPGDKIRVQAQSRIPADGIVADGESRVDRAILTGEATLFPVKRGGEVWAGSLNVGSTLIVEVRQVGHATEVGKISALVSRATQGRSPFLNWVDQLSRYFVVGILGLAALTLIIWVPRAGFEAAIDHVLALLIVSCPCALGLATPLALSLSVASAARRGVLIRTVDTLERLLKIKKVFFDKTGTLTRGEIAVESIQWEDEAVKKLGLTRDEVLSALGAIEAQIQHPIARAITNYCKNVTKNAPDPQIEKPEVIPGKGVICGDWKVGALEWVASSGSHYLMKNKTDTLVGASRQGVRVMTWVLRDELRPEARQVVGQLLKMGIDVSVISGDQTETVQSFSDILGLPKESLLGALSPSDKLEILKSAAQKGRVAMVGDGVNDAAALAAADVGFGMSQGAWLTLQSADVCLTRADLREVINILEHARKTRKVVLRNFGFSIVYNLVGSGMAVAGMMNPLVAAVLMPLSSLTVVSSTVLARVFKTNSRNI